MGSRPDGWWRDRPAARRRLVAGLESLGPDLSAGGLTIVFDGRPHPVDEHRIDVRWAPHADDLIADVAAPGDVVVTSDRELRHRCEAAGATVHGARWLLDRLPR